MTEYTFDEKDIILSRGTSKGYAKKFIVDGYWYKVSAGTFNAQAEVVASRLARLTELTDTVEYTLCKVNGEWATRSKDYIMGRKHETIKGLYLKVFGSPIETLEDTLRGRELYDFVCGFAETHFKLDFRETLNRLLRLDALVLNEDRHFRNIECIQDADECWLLSPPFDFDCALYSLVDDLDALDEYVQKAQPFFDTHDEQLAFLATVTPQRLVLPPFDPEELIRDVWTTEYSMGKAEILAYLNTIKGGAVI